MIMSRFQYAMIMFTLVLILTKLSSDPGESAVWQVVSAAWFMVMIINLVSQLIEYGKTKKDSESNDSKKGSQ